MKMSLEQKLDDHIHTEEKNLEDIQGDVKLIMTNHLAHVQESLNHQMILITKLDERVKLVLWILGVLGSLIIVEYFKK
jgi:hypothetical protein